MELLCVATMTIVESTRLDSTMRGRMNGHVYGSKGGAEPHVVVYKGKVFLFVSVDSVPKEASKSTETILRSNLVLCWWALSWYGPTGYCRYVKLVISSVRSV